MREVYVPETMMSKLQTATYTILSLEGSANDNIHFDNDLERIKRALRNLWENYDIQKDDALFDQCLQKLDVLKSYKPPKRTTPAVT